MDSVTKIVILLNIFSSACKDELALRSSPIGTFSKYEEMAFCKEVVVIIYIYIYIYIYSNLCIEKEFA